MSINWVLIDEYKARCMGRSFVEIKIRDAVFDCEKFPGLDGFSMVVFKDCYDVVKSDLVIV